MDSANSVCLPLSFNAPHVRIRKGKFVKTSTNISVKRFCFALRSDFQNQLRNDDQSTSPLTSGRRRDKNCSRVISRAKSCATNELTRQQKLTGLALVTTDEANAGICEWIKIE